MKINDDKLGKFDSRVDWGIFLGYSTIIKAYEFYNKTLCKFLESIDVRIDKACLEKEVEQPNENSEDTMYMIQEEITTKEE